MRAKIYHVDKVEELAKALSEAPALPPKTLKLEEILKRYTPQIRELHALKNYTPSEISRLFKEHGIMVPVKEVKNVLGLGANSTQKR
ncbi:hypothetical protein [Paucibacter sp. KCTC 42545]|uniref:hypothetical protein n=1 Tax=Paucibacter sp. KCTC 42545 TaxID=1768242 RepID=UPI0012E394EE|nr:hypothetical protein [Paucibacter sp. KCTC 42545]